MDTVLLIAVAAGATLVVAVLAFRSMSAERKAWQALATRRGWRFEDEAGARAFVEQSQVLKHFALGIRGWTENVISGRHQDHRIWLAKLIYQRHTGQHHDTEYQTICVVEWPGANWPHLVLHNRRDDDYLRTFLRDSPMPMTAAPETDDGFELWSENPETAQAFLGARGTEIARRGEPQLHVEVRGPWLLVHRGATLTAAEADNLLGDAFAVGGILAR